jgi:hypothetical protein
VSFVAASGVSASQGCSAALTAGDSYTDTFSIPTTGPNVGYLTCTEVDSGPIAAGTSTVPLVGGAPGTGTNVLGMNVLYGVDLACSGSVTNYLVASQITPAATWTDICSAPFGAKIKTVTVTLLFANPLYGETGQPSGVSLTQTMPYMNGL